MGKKINKKTLRLKYRLEPEGETDLVFQIYYLDKKFVAEKPYDEAVVRYNFRDEENSVLIEYSKEISITLKYDYTYQENIIIVELTDKNLENEAVIKFFSQKQRDFALKKINIALKKWSLVWFYRGW